MGLTTEVFAGSTAEWDRFAASQPGFTHFHRYGWKAVLEEVFGHRCWYLAARGTDGLTAVLPLVRVKSALFGHFMVSMPFLNYGGPVGSDEGTRLLAEAAREQAMAAGARLLELRSRIDLGLPLTVSHRKITVVLDLPRDSETLFESFPSKLRSQVRRPGKEGVTVRFGPDQVIPFFEVFSSHMRDLGTPTLPLRFFQTIARDFPTDAWFGCAWLNDRPVASGAGFRWAHEFEMTWASALTSFNRIAPNMLLYWEFMQRAIAEGLRVFNFGRCTKDSGTHRFKRQWGSRDEPLWWYQWSSAGALDATPSADQGRYAWGQTLWRHLPLGLSRFLGPHIVKYLP